MSSKAPTREFRALDILLPAAELAAMPEHVDSPTDVALSGMDKVIRQAYILAYCELTQKWDYGQEPMSHWDGGVDRFGKRHKSVWPRIARLVLTVDADPLQYVLSQFCGADPRRPPLPNTLLGEAAQTRYRTYCLGSDERMARQLQYEMLSVNACFLPLCQSGWESVRAMRYALCNSDVVTASKLLRYCVAVRESLPDIAERFHADALTQYVFQNKAYDRTWILQGEQTSFIPVNLREEGAALRRRLLGA